MSFSLFQET